MVQDFYHKIHIIFCPLLLRPETKSASGVAVFHRSARMFPDKPPISPTLPHPPPHTDINRDKTCLTSQAREWHVQGAASE